MPIDGKIAYLSAMTDVIAINQRTFKSFIHIVCHQHLLTVNIVLYYPKNFYLKSAIDEKISIFITSGLVNHWIGKFVDMKFFEYKSKDKAGPTKLYIRNLSGALSLWIVGCAASLIAFALEHLFHNFCCKY